MMIDRSVLTMLGMLCLIAPGIIAMIDGAGHDDADVWQWLAQKPHSTILGMQMMMFVGFLLMMVAAGVPR